MHALLGDGSWARVGLGALPSERPLPLDGTCLSRRAIPPGVVAVLGRDGQRQYPTRDTVVTMAG